MAPKRRHSVHAHVIADWKRKNEDEMPVGAMK